MRRSALFVLLAVVAAAGQAANPVRVCVAPMKNESRGTLATRPATKTLVREINDTNPKKPKPNEVRLEASLLDEDSDNRGACELTVYTVVQELRNQNEPREPNRPGSIQIGSDPLGHAPKEPASHDLTYYAVLEYRIVRSGRTLRAVSISTTEAGTPDSAVNALLRRVASSVKAEARPSTHTPE